MPYTVRYTDLSARISAGNRVVPRVDMPRPFQGRGFFVSACILTETDSGDLYGADERSKKKDERKTGTDQG